MTRRVIEHTRRSREGELFTSVTIMEEGVSKEQIKKEYPWTLRHSCLINKKGQYSYKSTS